MVSNDARQLLLAQLSAHDGVEYLQGCVELDGQRLAAGQGQGETAQRQDCVLKVLEDGVELAKENEGGGDESGVSIILHLRQRNAEL